MTQATTQTNGAIQPAQKHPVQLFSAYVESRKGALGKIIPKTLTLDRVMKVAIAAFARTPELWNCSLESVYQAVNQSITLGLEPGSPLGHAYLVPYKGTCTLVVGYKGLISLARRSGEIASIEAHVVYDTDRYEVKFGSEGRLIHEPNFDVEPGKPKLVYAIATFRDGVKQWEVMRLSEVDKIRDRSPAAKSSRSPWTTDYLEMAKKTVIRRLCKMLPLSVELADALDADNDEKAGAVDLASLAPTVETTATSEYEPQQPALAEDTGAQVAPQTQSERVAAELRAPRENSPAEKRAAAQTIAASEQDLLAEIARAKNTGDLNRIGGRFEKARADLGEDAENRVGAALRARWNELSK